MTIDCCTTVYFNCANPNRMRRERLMEMVMPRVTFRSTHLLTWDVSTHYPDLQNIWLALTHFSWNLLPIYNCLHLVFEMLTRTSKRLPFKETAHCSGSLISLYSCFITVSVSVKLEFYYSRNCKFAKPLVRSQSGVLWLAEVGKLLAYQNFPGTCTYG